MGQSTSVTFATCITKVTLQDRPDLLIIVALIGHNSIVYHARRHVGDYPYKCGEPGCNFHEVNKLKKSKELFD